MEEDKILLSHSADLKSRADENSMITSTNFLDLRQCSLLRSLERIKAETVKTFYYGGYDDAERVCAVFVPSFYDINDGVLEYFNLYPEDNPLCLLKVTKDRFSSVGHRDYLGALMGLGLKREVIGDIIYDDNGAYIITLRQNSRFICENLKSVGRATVDITQCDFSCLSQRKEAFEDITAFIASERLDNIVSAAFSLSRTNSVSFIQKGLVFVNSLEITKPDYKASIGDKIVVRGKGKAIFYSVNGKSKKDRLHITIKKYK